MASIYDSINEQQLQEYALKAGFGNDYPIDLEELKNFFKKGDKILEVGCGTGRLGKYLIKDYDYTGIDTCARYLECFRGILINQGIKKTENYVINSSFLDFIGNNFNVIIFPWSIFWDFTEKEQAAVLKKAGKMITPDGVILLDNPAEGSAHNSVKDYLPVSEFHYDNWKNKFLELGFSKHDCIKYKTLTGRAREITVLKK